MHISTGDLIRLEIKKVSARHNHTTYTDKLCC